MMSLVPTVVSVTLVAVLCCVAIALAAAVWLSFCAPRLDFATLPTGEGACGPGFRVEVYDGVTVLIENDLPYPGSLDSTNRASLPLGGHWDFATDPRETGLERGLQCGEDAVWPDGLCESVFVPHCFNSAQSQHSDYYGVAWYRVRFQTPDSDSNHWFRLRFEAVLLHSTVWLNGVELGSRSGGYTPFCYDVTAALQRASGAVNTIVVRVDNRLTWTSLPPRTALRHNPGWHPYGGIYRPVSIESVPEISILKVEADCRREQRAVQCRTVIQRRTDRHEQRYQLDAVLWAPDGCECSRAVVQGSHSVDSRSADAIGTTAGGISVARFTLPVTEPVCYEDGAPRLYRLKLTLSSTSNAPQSVPLRAPDEVSLLLGFREVRVCADGIEINGRLRFLRGISRHEDHPHWGAAQPQELIDKDLDWVQRLNANYVRLAHYPHAAAELGALRDRGIWASEEIALYQAGLGFASWIQENRRPRDFPWRAFGLHQLRRRELMLNAQRELLETIERDRNNPAILFWSIGNECYTLFRSGARPFAWLRRVAREADPSRPVSMAEATYNVRLLDSRRSALKQMDFISLNLYYGWYYGAAAHAARHLDRVRRYHPHKPIVISEFGADAAPGRSEADGLWKAERVRRGKSYSEEYQERLMRQYCQLIEERPFICGISPWVFADFFCSWFPGNPIPFYNLKGLLSRERLPKRAFYALSELYRQRLTEERGKQEQSTRGTSERCGSADRA
ncbi:MAG: hypothetical protein EA404_15380 [Spirochaetaceae bacterium]|nr:MAG: hypothetical protein EA404_15380 [Spirochaetaceae bacterium]